MKLGHDAFDDMCDSIVEESVRFDASELISTVAAEPFNATVLMPGASISALYDGAR